MGERRASNFLRILSQFIKVKGHISAHHQRVEDLEENRQFLDRAQLRGDVEAWVLQQRQRGGRVVGLEDRLAAVADGQRVAPLHQEVVGAAGVLNVVGDDRSDALEALGAQRQEAGGS